MKIFPNPTTGKLTIVFPKYLVVTNDVPPIKSITTYHQWESTILEAYDLNGNQMYQKEIPKDKTQLEIDVSAWPKGMYFFSLGFNKQMVASERVIIE